MRHRRFAATIASMLLLGAPLWVIGCEPIPTNVTTDRVLEGGEGSESLPLSVRHRAPVAGEPLPRVRIEPAAGAVKVRVDRAAFCNTQARATIDRASGQLIVVARVGADPAALCASMFNLVVGYEGVVSGLAPGRYRVWVYEAVADGKPTLLSSTAVAVGS